MDLIKEGQRLSIYFQKGNNLVEICCTVIDIWEDRILLELPPYFMRYIEFLEVGCALTAKAFGKVGTVDFNTVVITSPMEENFSVELDTNAMKLTPLEEIPFVDTIVCLKFSKGDQICNVSTIGVATEYLKFSANQDFALDETYDCTLLLPKNYGIIKFRGTITERDSVYEDEYKMVYSSMAEADRQTLLYYMYVYSSDFD